MYKTAQGEIDDLKRVGNYHNHTHSTLTHPHDHTPTIQIHVPMYPAVRKMHVVRLIGLTGEAAALG